MPSQCLKLLWSYLTICVPRFFSFINIQFFNVIKNTEKYCERLPLVNYIRKTISRVCQRVLISSAQIFTIKHNIKTWRSWNQRDATGEVLCDFMSNWANGLKIHMTKKNMEISNSRGAQMEKTCLFYEKCRHSRQEKGSEKTFVIFIMFTLKIIHALFYY